jgi:hypothetical protein
VPIFIIAFLVRSIRAHGIRPTKPHSLRLQSVCVTHNQLGARI